MHIIYGTEIKSLNIYHHLIQIIMDKITDYQTSMFVNVSNIDHDKIPNFMAIITEIGHYTEQDDICII